MNSQMIDEFNDLTKGRQYSQMNSDTLGELFKRVEGMKKLLSDMQEAITQSEYQILKRLESIGEKTPYKQAVTKSVERSADISEIYSDKDIRLTISGMAVSDSPFSDYIIKNVIRDEKEALKFVDVYNAFWAWVKDNREFDEEEIPANLDSDRVEELVKAETSIARYKKGQLEGQPKLQMSTSLDEKRGTMTARNNYVAVYGIKNLKI